MAGELAEHVIETLIGLFNPERQIIMAEAAAEHKNAVTMIKEASDAAVKRMAEQAEQPHINIDRWGARGVVAGKTPYARNLVRVQISQEVKGQGPEQVYTATVEMLDAGHWITLATEKLDTLLYMVHRRCEEDAVVSQEDREDREEEECGRARDGAIRGALHDADRWLQMK